MPSPGNKSRTDAPARDFDDFYRRNYKAALALVRLRAAGADCEALVADAFLVTWQHFAQTGELSRAWFFAVIRNKVGDFYRSGRRHDVPGDEFPGTFVEDTSDESDTYIDVHRTLRRLPPMHAEPLALQYWGGLSGAEAAQALGISPGAWRVRLHRARQAFEQELRGVEPGGIKDEEVTPWIAQRN